ncbi:MAG: hypothetical protein H7233_02380 [Pseudorhodobacter sp.]|nr:hypothetical protein [Frankiaceae bacterium]
MSRLVPDRELAADEAVPAGRVVDAVAWPSRWPSVDLPALVRRARRE